MLTSDTKRPATVFVLLNQDCRYGKKGDRVQFSGFRAKQVVEAGYGTEIADEPRTDNKAIQSEPAKRGPGRPRKVAIDDKAVA
jgi:hypothetical protein